LGARNKLRSTRNSTGAGLSLPATTPLNENNDKGEEIDVGSTGIKDRMRGLHSAAWKSNPRSKTGYGATEKPPVSINKLPKALNAQSPRKTIAVDGSPMSGWNTPLTPVVRSHKKESTTRMPSPSSSNLATPSQSKKSDVARTASPSITSLSPIALPDISMDNGPETRTRPESSVTSSDEREEIDIGPTSIKDRMRGLHSAAWKSNPRSKTGKGVKEKPRLSLNKLPKAPLARSPKASEDRNTIAVDRSDAKEKRKAKVKAALESSSYPPEVEKSPAGEKPRHFDPSGWKTLESGSLRKATATTTKAVNSTSPKKMRASKQSSTDSNSLPSTDTNAKAFYGDMPLAGGEMPLVDESSSSTKTRSRSYDSKREKVKSVDVDSEGAADAARTRSKSTDAKKISRSKSKDSKATTTRQSRRKEAAATKLQAFIRGAMARQRVINMVSGMIEELQNSMRW
jgi:hypothetical protein